MTPLTTRPAVHILRLSHQLGRRTRTISSRASSPSAGPSEKHGETLMPRPIDMSCKSGTGLAPKPRRWQHCEKGGGEATPSFAERPPPPVVGFSQGTPPASNPVVVGLRSTGAILNWSRTLKLRGGLSHSIISTKPFHTASAVVEESSLISQGKPEDMRNEIYCHGTLLAAVQSARLFVDCKHFVDMPLKQDAETTLTNWNKLISETENGQIEPLALATFVNEYFEQPGGELEDYEPLDYQHDVNFEVIEDPAYRAWALELHRKWPTLCRRVSDKVSSDPSRFSLIPVPNPFVVPGGRFREMYYWDSFFTIKGLLASQMFDTVRGMIANMGHLIDTYGYIPNGNRIYYLNRSQPPLLTWCVDAYYQRTGDLEFVRQAMPWLEKEMAFFTTNRRIHQADWKVPLYRFHVVATGPRPESYREDVECADHIAEAPGKLRLWGDIMAAAESGRDFSARWFNSEGPHAGQMGSTRTSSILPVELNSIICGNLRTFSEFYNLLGNSEAAAKTMNEFQDMRETMHQVFWNEEVGSWFDYDLDAGKHVADFFDTNLFPMFAGCVHEGFDPSRIVGYLEHAGVLNFPGGVPTSLIPSGQQWDFPNAWAPTTWVIIQGLRRCGADDLAKNIAAKWTKKNFNMSRNNGGRMFEKYNVATQCYKAAGGGGEYELQEGFGWTNGVILDLLLTYSHELGVNTEDVDIPDCPCCSIHNDTIVDSEPPTPVEHCGNPEPCNVVVNFAVTQKA
uniref:Trehalase n=1 Tax=Panagrellus redivivus TaxID=6233 RepID=A0A7E4VWB3_PANRE